MSHKKIVIIGNGIAGVSAGQAASKEFPEAEILLLTGENQLTYYRTRLAEVFGEGKDLEDIQVHPPQWYTANRIHIELGCRVDRICPGEKKVFSGDRSFSYDRLILANGAASVIPPIPGSNLPHVDTLRSFEDAAQISTKLHQAQSVLVVGGGVLGLEIAYQMRKRGIVVTVLEMMPHLLPRQLDKAGAAILEKRISRLGIKIVKGDSVARILEKPVVQLASGASLEADLVVLAAGVKPNLDLADDAGLVINRGILVDKTMKTSHPDIFACGDIAECQSKWFGLWTIAMQQGRTAGINAAKELKGDTAIIEMEQDSPPYYLNTMETKLYSMGDLESAEDTGSVDIFHDPENLIYRKLVFRADVFTGFILIGDVTLSAQLVNGIKKGALKENILALI